MGFIKALFKFITVIVGLVAIAIGLTMFAARFADGPWALISGGPFTTGTLVENQTDWSFLKDRTEVEFELVGAGSSRTSWVVEHNNRVFIPSGYMNTTIGKIWKHWPYDAEKDGRIILRVDDKLYHHTLKRVIDDPDMPVVRSELARKYGGAGFTEVPESEVTSGNLWVFELIPSA